MLSKQLGNLGFSYQQYFLVGYFLSAHQKVAELLLNCHTYQVYQFLTQLTAFMQARQLSVNQVVIPIYLNHLYLKEKKNQKKKTIQLGQWDKNLSHQSSYCTVVHIENYVRQSQSFFLTMSSLFLLFLFFILLSKPSLICSSN